MTAQRVQFAAVLTIFLAIFSAPSDAAEKEEITRLLSEALEANEQEEPFFLRLEMDSGQILAYAGNRLQLPFLSTDEVYDLLTRYPVLCDGSDGDLTSYDLLECFKFTFDSKSTGTVLYRLKENDDIVVDGYWTAPFEVNDRGLCLKLSQRESDVEIEVLDEEDAVSRYQAETTASAFEKDDSVAWSCYNFAYPEGHNALQSDMIINQVLINELLNPIYKYSISSSPMALSDVWTMEP